MFSNDKSGWNDDVLIGITPEEVGVSANKRFACVHQDSASQVRTIVVDDTDAVVNTWYHIAITCDSSSLRLYVNAALKDTTAKAGTALIYGGNTTYFGQNVGNDSVGDYDGDLDDVRFFDRVLTQTEIDGLYNDGDGTEDDSGK